MSELLSILPKYQNHTSLKKADFLGDTGVDNNYIYNIYIILFFMQHIPFDTFFYVKV